MTADSARIECRYYILLHSTPLQVPQEIKKENRDVKVVFVDADINKELVKKYKIRGVPVFIVFKNGKENFRHVGLISKNEIINKIK